MRWFLTNASPLADELRAAGEEVVGTEADHQLAHLDWLQRLVAMVPADYAGDRVAAAFDLVDGNPAWASDGFSRALLQLEGGVEPGALTSDYPLHRILLNLRPEVVVLTPFYQPSFGFPTGSIMQWRNMVGLRAPRVLVGIGQDPQTWEAAIHRRGRGCALRMEHLTVYATNDAGIARRSAAERRTATWAPGASLSSLMAAVRHAAALENYQAGTLGRVFV